MVIVKRGSVCSFVKRSTIRQNMVVPPDCFAGVNVTFMEIWREVSWIPHSLPMKLGWYNTYPENSSTRKTAWSKNASRGSRSQLLCNRHNRRPDQPCFQLHRRLRFNDQINMKFRKEVSWIPQGSSPKKLG